MTEGVKKIDKKIGNLNSEIIDSELKILVKIGFDLEIILPYKFLENNFAFLLKILKENFKTFLQTTTNFINDSFKLPLCLYYDPKLIALTSVLMTAKLFNITLSDEDKVKWLYSSDNTVKSEVLQEIATIMNNMYMNISSPSKEKVDLEMVKTGKKKLFSSLKLK
jgi:hypothetical protein